MRAGPTTNPCDSTSKACLYPSTHTHYKHACQHGRKSRPTRVSARTPAPTDTHACTCAAHNACTRACTRACTHAYENGQTSASANNNKMPRLTIRLRHSQTDWTARGWGGRDGTEGGRLGIEQHSQMNRTEVAVFINTGRTNNTAGSGEEGVRRCAKPGF